MKIYVGNLSHEVTEDELSAEFGTYGKVDSVAIPSDKYSGRPRGFAFVEMGSKTEAEAAIAGLNGKMLQEKGLIVNEARPKSDSRGSAGNRSSFGNRGGYSGGRQGGRQGGRPGGGFGGKGRSRRDY